MTVFKYIFLLGIFSMINGCEGGMGGTGPSGTISPVTSTGSANKGPYSDTASVTSRTVLASGTLAAEVVTGAMAGGIYGGFEITTDSDTTQLVEIRGAYFSENTGTILDTAQEAVISLKGVILAGQDPANVNVATHLIHLRVIDLISSGMATTTAIDTAELELLLALSDLIPMPVNAIDFSNLVVINAQPESVNREGNGWLLALSSILEKAALTLNDSSGIGTESEVANLLAILSADLESDGTLSDQNLVDLLLARSKVNPDLVHRHLLFLDDSLRQEVLVASGEATAEDLDDYACGAFQGDILCAELGVDGSDAVDDILLTPIVDESVVLITQPLSDSIADMNAFIDTDNDGIVNALDTDDDNDGIPDSIDPAPYEPDTETQPTALLVPPASEAEFIQYLRNGLELWAGLTEDSAVVEASIMMGSPFIAASQIDVLEIAVAEAGDGLASTLDSTDALSGTVDSSSNFTETNLLVEGVDEIDVAKYNGSHLYLATGNRIQILETKTDGSAAEIVNTILVTDDPGEYVYSSGLYLYEQGASSILAGIRNYNNIIGRIGIGIDTLIAPWGWNGTTIIDLFDVKDPMTAARTGELRLEGSYVDSRRIGKTLYVITRFTPDLPGIIQFAKTDAARDANQSLIDALDVSDMLPQVTDGNGEVRPLVTTDACFLPATSLEHVDRQIYYPTLTTVTAIDLLDPGSFESICMTDGIYGVHVSENAIYLAALEHTFNEADQYFEQTIVHKFNIGDGLTGYAGSGSVAGTFWGDPKFLMGEHEGKLTLVTTVNTPGAQNQFQHRLTILDDANGVFELEELSHLPNELNPAPIGKPNEQIFASRIVGDRAFLVTFERTDPVYIIDLSDTSNPMIAGELEIPGFSTYLHPISDDLLLGIGKDSITYEGIPYFQGMNMRLFDVSDPEHIKVLSDIKIGQRGTESAVFWDSHAFTILPGSADTPHRIAVPIRVAGLSQSDSSLLPWQYYHWSEDALYLFEIDEQSPAIVSIGKLVSQDLITGQVWQPGCCNWNDRSFMNGEIVHYLHHNRLYSANWTSSDSSQALFIPTLFKDEATEICTAQVATGMGVYVFDRTDQSQLDCPMITASEADFSQVLHENCSTSSGLIEREGSYVISVDVDGYLPWQRGDVRVQADSCHVGFTWMNVYLEKQ